MFIRRFSKSAFSPNYPASFSPPPASRQTPPVHRRVPALVRHMNVFEFSPVMSQNDQNDVARLLDTRKRLKRRVCELEEKLEHAKRKLEEVDVPLRALVEQVDVKSRVRLDSRRGRRILNRASKENKFKISGRPPEIDFATSFTSVSVDTNVMAKAFRSCGGGSLILSHILQLWDDDPVMAFMSAGDAHTIRIGNSIEHAKCLLDLGLCSMEAIAEVFGGCFDLSTKKLQELREMAHTIGLSINKKNQKKKAEQLRTECRPLLIMSPKNFITWIGFRRKRGLYRQILQFARFFQELVQMPIDQAFLVDELNRDIRAAGPLPERVFELIGMQYIPHDHLARYRPRLLRHMLEQVDAWKLEHGWRDENTGLPVANRLRDYHQPLRSWIERTTLEDVMEHVHGL